MSWRRRAADTGLAVALVAGVTVIVAAAESVSHVSNISNLYIIGVAVLASRRGLYSAVLAAVLAFAAYDWFFVPPVHEFTVADPSEYVALLTLLVTIVIIGQLLAVARTRADEAQSHQRQTQLLYEVSQAALSSPQIATVYPMALWRLNTALGLTGSQLFLLDGQALHQVAASGTLAESPDERTWLEGVRREGHALVVWQQAHKNMRVAAALPLDVPAIEAPEGGRLYQILLPLQIESQVEGVLIVGEKRNHEPMTGEDVQLLVAFTNQLAVAVQRQSRAEQQARARALEESERLKSALISSVSHELKTPLAAIKASATTLLDEAADASASARRDLAEAINRETDRLTRLVSNLLDMSRLEAGALRPQLESGSIGDVIDDVLDRLESVLAGREVRLVLPEHLPLVPLDFVQISQVLTNLLDNAVRYSPPSAPIVISAEVVREQLRVSVFNAGSHIPGAELERLFDKFYRLGSGSGGVGLGLSIARGIVEAHGGRIWADNVGRRGVRFTFVLPAPAEPPEAAGTADPSLQSVV